MQNDDQQTFWTTQAGPSWVTRMTAMDAAFDPILDEVFRLADFQRGDAIVDIGCGAGTSTLEAARRVGPIGRALGVDISQTLLDAACQRIDQQVNLQFELADAQVHPFEPEAFDGLISRFGLMFFEDPSAAFQNMAKALSTEGKMIFATWGAIPENPFFTLPSQVASDVIGKAPKADPDDPGPFSLRDVDRVTDLLDHAGMTQIKAYETQLMLTPHGTAGDLADLLCEIGSAQRILAYYGSDSDQRATLLLALEKALQQYVTPQGLRVPALINFFTAQRR
ncbi:MAG: methyltransferase domain-containing protein [Sulfitobacter sp.]